MKTETKVAVIETFASSKAADENNRRRNTVSDELRDRLKANTDKALDIVDYLLCSTASRLESHKELSVIGIGTDVRERPTIINYLASDEYTANYDNRLATARIVRDHLIAAHLAYREAKNYKALFAAAKLEAANNAGIKAATDAAAAQSAVRLAQYASLCDTFGARDYASVAYLLRNRLTSWARFDSTASAWIVSSPIIGAAKGADKWRQLSADDIRDVRDALHNASRAVAESPDQAFVRTLVSVGLMEASEPSVSKDTMEASADAVNLAVDKKDRLPIVDSFAALNVNNAVLCLKAWIAEHTLDDAATLAAALQAAIVSAFPADAATAQPAASETESEVYADDESAVLNS